MCICVLSIIIKPCIYSLCKAACSSALPNTESRKLKLLFCKKQGLEKNTALFKMNVIKQKELTHKHKLNFRRNYLIM